MTDDLSVFWQNDERARTLFYELLERSERAAYDDDFLARLAAYREAECLLRGGTDAPNADIFAARYLLHHGDAEAAIVCGRRSLLRHAVNHAAWDVLIRSYEALGRYGEALVMQGYAASLHPMPFSIEGYPTEAMTGDVLARLSVVMSRPASAPTAVRMSYDPEKGITAAGGVFVGEHLPADTHDPPYYVGVYAEQGMQGDRAWMISVLQNAPGVLPFGAGDFVFDIMRGTRAPGTAHIDLAPGQKVVLPVIGTVVPVPGVHTPQHLRITTPSFHAFGWLNGATPNFFRLNESTDFASKESFIVGTPIHIGHSPQRRRLVLNILADALPWQVLRNSFAAAMPQTARFFTRGTIFDRHFSVAEYTYPSFATIETGMYPQHSQIFHSNVHVPLRTEYVTLAERMRELGYATANLMGDGIGVYNGVTRGYDRLLIASYRQQNYEAVARVIRHLEGLGDADHFILIHSSDVHPFPSPLFQYGTAAQAHLPLRPRLTELVNAPPSPYLIGSPLNQEAFRLGVRELDRTLGMLFAYLEENYAPEDYLVNLYSDHGVSIFSEHPHIVDPLLTGATWMMRGAGVPEGVVTDELTSPVDIYPTLAHLCGFPVGENVDGVLPQVFGGTGRDITFSNSLYPGKPYFLTARTKTHSFCLETEDGVAPNGTVDLARANVAIYPRAHEREAGCEVDSPELRAFFYPRVRAFLQGIGSNGEQFPSPKEI